jgi:hypothetical protein
MVSGALLQLLGYWPTWSAPLALLALNFIARLVMIEAPPALRSFPSSSSLDTDNTAVSPEQEETAPILSSGFDGYQSTKSSPSVTEAKTSPRGFYRIVLADARILVGLINTVMLSAILSGFDATLPLHLQNVFGWGSLPVGMIFLGLQVPGILLGPLIGWLRDRIGLRYPTTLGWALLVPLLWLLAVPGHHDFAWARPETNGKIIFISGIVGIGFAFLLIRGAGTFQLVGKLANILMQSHPLFDVLVLICNQLSPMNCSPKIRISLALMGATPKYLP